MKTTKSLLFSALMGIGLLCLGRHANAQTTYVPAANLLSTNGGWGASSNGGFVLGQLQTGTITNITQVLNITKMGAVTLFSRFDAMGTNAANSNIVFQAYTGVGGSPASSGNSTFNSTSNGLPAFTPATTGGVVASAASMAYGVGYFARDTALDFTNSVNGANSVSNIYTITGLGGRGFVYWTVSYTGTNVLTNFVLTAGGKNNL